MRDPEHQVDHDRAAGDDRGQLQGVLTTRVVQRVGSRSAKPSAKVFWTTSDDRPGDQQEQVGDRDQRAATAPASRGRDP